MTDLAEPVSTVRIGMLPASRMDLLRRALARACQAGARAAAVEGPVERILADADVIVSLPWPPTDERPAVARAAMTARKPLIVLEMTSTAEWPALDPQTWQPRGFAGDPPIVVSIDPRDEEHSLMLAILRLANDALLRRRLADAAYAWATSHA